MTERDDSPLEAYLDDLWSALRAAPARDARHLLAEAEAHLRDAAAAGVAAGLDPVGAEQEAVHRFGAARVIARAEQRAAPRRPLASVLRECAGGAWLLGSLGALAVGLSGLLAALIRALAGAPFLADSAAGHGVDPANCARWLALAPRAASCHAAAITDWANETVGYRVLAGLLGLAALATFAVLRRRGRVTLPPVIVLDTVAVAAFGLAAAVTGLLGLGATVTAAGHGAGQWLSAVLVALPASAIAGVRATRALRAL